MSVSAFGAAAPLARTPPAIPFQRLELLQLMRRSRVLSCANRVPPEVPWAPRRLVWGGEARPDSEIKVPHLCVEGSRWTPAQASRALEKHASSGTAPALRVVARRRGRSD